MASGQSVSTPAVVHGQALAIGTGPVAGETAVIQNAQAFGDSGPGVQLLLENTDTESSAGVRYEVGDATGFIIMTGEDSADLPPSTLIVGNASAVPGGIGFIADGENPAMLLTSGNDLEMVSGSIYTGEDGGFATPSFSFKGDDTSGFWRGAGSVYVSVAGGTAMQWTTSENFSYFAMSPANDGNQSLGSTGNRWSQLFLSATVTPGGTTGAQIINKPAGSVNFAAAATSLVVTNSLVTADSIVLVTVGTNDTTMLGARAVAGVGSFTIYATGTPTAETRVNFLVLN